MRYPDYAVLRHSDNKKWFGLIMDVPRKNLGLSGDGRVDILNAKLGDPLMRDLLVSREGYLRGYHIGGGTWISIILDGTVPLEEILHWLDVSYSETASRRKKQRSRQPKEWIIPANPKYYDIEGAFEASDEIDWKQGKGIIRGDTVYMYVAAPVSAILYKCIVTQTGIPFDYSGGNVNITALMKLKLIKKYDRSRFSFERLGSDYGIYAVRGPRGVPISLSRDLDR